MYSKYSALGNTYIIVDPNKSDVRLTAESIKQLCADNGSDGILYGPSKQSDIFSLQIFNPDGSEAEKSGNGIRIFAKYLFDAGYIKEKKFDVQTLGGLVHVALLNADATIIAVDMGVVTFLGKETFTFDNQQYLAHCISIGNPHCVILLNDISKALALTIGPKIENDPRFPNRTNVQFVKVLDRNNIQIEIWERGAGYTSASGTSSCAAASVTHKLGLTGPDVTVHMPGGEIKIVIQKNGRVVMTGPVTPTASLPF